MRSDKIFIVMMKQMILIIFLTQIILFAPCFGKYSSPSPNNGNAEIFINKAWEQYKNKDYRNSKDSFLKALKIEPNNADILSGIGYCYYSENMFKKANEYFVRANSISQNKNTLIMIGYCNEHLGRYPAAADVFKKAYDIDPPGSLNILLELGNIYTWHIKDPKKTRKILNMISKYGAKDINTYKSLLSFYWFGLNDYENAEYYYNKTFLACSEQLQKKPDDISALFGLGELYMNYMNKYRDYDKAAVQFNKILEIDVENITAYAYLGSLLTIKAAASSGYSRKLFLDQINMAMDKYNKALEIDPFNAKANEDICNVYAAHKTFRGKAIECIKRMQKNKIDDYYIIRAYTIVLFEEISKYLLFISFGLLMFFRCFAFKSDKFKYVASFSIYTWLFIVFINFYSGFFVSIGELLYIAHINIF